MKRMDTAGEMLSADEKTFTVQLKPASKLEMDDDQCNNPDIVTNKFLDILWQDVDGNSALMLAAAENRILHVKGILRMAHERRKLCQVLNMRNINGLTALQIAVEAGNESCAKLITRFTNESRKCKPHFSNMPFMKSKNQEASENEIKIEFDDLMTSSSVQFGSHRPVKLEPTIKRLTRNKLNNDLKRAPTMDYMLKKNTSGKPENSMPIKRTLSGGSFTALQSPSSLTTSTKIDGNKSNTVGDKLRSIFSSGKRTDSESFTNRRPMDYRQDDNENSLLQRGQSPANISGDLKDSAEMFHSPLSHGLFLQSLANLRRRPASMTRCKPGQEHW